MLYTQYPYPSIAQVLHFVRNFTAKEQMTYIFFPIPTKGTIMIVQ